MQWINCDITLQKILTTFEKKMFAANMQQMLATTELLWCLARDQKHPVVCSKHKFLPIWSDLAWPGQSDLIRSDLESNLIQSGFCQQPELSKLLVLRLSV